MTELKLNIGLLLLGIFFIYFLATVFDLLEYWFEPQEACKKFMRDQFSKIDKLIDECPFVVAGQFRLYIYGLHVQVAVLAYLLYYITPEILQLWQQAQK